MFNSEQKTINRLTDFDPKHYNEDYYAGKTSNWKIEYTWPNFGAIFMGWAGHFIQGFPYAKRFLDAGCARGFLELAFMKTCNKYGIEREIIGFDVSEYAIKTAPVEIRNKIYNYGIAEFPFEKFGQFDVLISLDVFEHCTEQDVVSFLTRAKNFINQYAFFVIALDEERQRYEPSHINLHDREYWEELLTDTGWFATNHARNKQKLSMNDPFVRGVKAEVFIRQPFED